MLPEDIVSAVSVKVFKNKLDNCVQNRVKKCGHKQKKGKYISTLRDIDIPAKVRL